MASSLRAKAPGKAADRSYASIVAHDGNDDVDDLEATMTTYDVPHGAKPSFSGGTRTGFRGFGTIPSAASEASSNGTFVARRATPCAFADAEADTDEDSGTVRRPNAHGGAWLGDNMATALAAAIQGQQPRGTAEAHRARQDRRHGTEGQTANGPSASPSSAAAAAPARKRVDETARLRERFMASQQALQKVARKALARRKTSPAAASLSVLRNRHRDADRAIAAKEEDSRSPSASIAPHTGRTGLREEDGATPHAPPQHSVNSAFFGRRANSVALSEGLSPNPSASLSAGSPLRLGASTREADPSTSLFPIPLREGKGRSRRLTGGADESVSSPGGGRNALLLMSVSNLNSSLMPGNFLRSPLDRSLTEGVSHHHHHNNSSSTPQHGHTVRGTAAPVMPAYRAGHSARAAADPIPGTSSSHPRSDPPDATFGRTDTGTGGGGEEDDTGVRHRAGAAFSFLVPNPRGEYVRLGGQLLQMPRVPSSSLGVASGAPFPAAEAGPLLPTSAGGVRAASAAAAAAAMLPGLSSERAALARGLRLGRTHTPLSLVPRVGAAPPSTLPSPHLAWADGSTVRDGRGSATSVAVAGAGSPSTIPSFSAARLNRAHEMSTSEAMSWLIASTTHAQQSRSHFSASGAVSPPVFSVGLGPMSYAPLNAAAGASGNRLPTSPSAPQSLPPSPQLAGTRGAAAAAGDVAAAASLADSPLTKDAPAARARMGRAAPQAGVRRSTATDFFGFADAQSAAAADVVRTRDVAAENASASAAGGVAPLRGKERRRGPSVKKRSTTLKTKKGTTHSGTRAAAGRRSAKASEGPEEEGTESAGRGVSSFVAGSLFFSEESRGNSFAVGPPALSAPRSPAFFDSSPARQRSPRGGSGATRASSGWGGDVGGDSGDAAGSGTPAVRASHALRLSTPHRARWVPDGPAVAAAAASDESAPALMHNISFGNGPNLLFPMGTASFAGGGGAAGWEGSTPRSVGSRSPAPLGKGRESARPANLPTPTRSADVLHKMSLVDLNTQLNGCLYTSMFENTIAQREARNVRRHTQVEKGRLEDTESATSMCSVRTFLLTAGTLTMVAGQVRQALAELQRTAAAAGRANPNEAAPRGDKDAESGSPDAQEPARSEKEEPLAAAALSSSSAARHAAVSATRRAAADASPQNSNDRVASGPHTPVHPTSVHSGNNTAAPHRGMLDAEDSADSPLHSPLHGLTREMRTFVLPSTAAIGHGEAAGGGGALTDRSRSSTMTDGSGGGTAATAADAGMAVGHWSAANSPYKRRCTIAAVEDSFLDLSWHGEESDKQQTEARPTGKKEEAGTGNASTPEQLSFQRKGDNPLASSTKEQLTAGAATAAFVNTSDDGGTACVAGGDDDERLSFVNGVDRNRPGEEDGRDDVITPSPSEEEDVFAHQRVVHRRTVTNRYCERDELLRTPTGRALSDEECALEHGSSGGLAAGERTGTPPADDPHTPPTTAVSDRNAEGMDPDTHVAEGQARRDAAHDADDMLHPCPEVSPSSAMEGPRACGASPDRGGVVPLVKHARTQTDALCIEYASSSLSSSSSSTAPREPRCASLSVADVEAVDLLLTDAFLTDLAEKLRLVFLDSSPSHHAGPSADDARNVQTSSKKMREAATERSPTVVLPALVADEERTQPYLTLPVIGLEVRSLVPLDSDETRKRCEAAEKAAAAAAEAAADAVANAAAMPHTNAASAARRRRSHRRGRLSMAFPEATEEKKAQMVEAGIVLAGPQPHRRKPSLPSFSHKKASSSAAAAEKATESARQQRQHMGRARKEGRQRKAMGEGRGGIARGRRDSGGEEAGEEVALAGDPAQAAKLTTRDERSRGTEAEKGGGPAAPILNVALCDSQAVLAVIAMATPQVQQGNVREQWSQFVRSSSPSVAQQEFVLRNIVYSILQRLLALHERGAAHGSVKPTNVFSFHAARRAAEENRRPPPAPTEEAEVPADHPRDSSSNLHHPYTPTDGGSVDAEHVDNKVAGGVATSRGGSLDDMRAILVDFSASTVKSHPPCGSLPGNGASSRSAHRAAVTLSPLSSDLTAGERGGGEEEGEGRKTRQGFATREPTTVTTDDDSPVVGTATLVPTSSASAPPAAPSTSPSSASSRGSYTNRAERRDHHHQHLQKQSIRERQMANRKRRVQERKEAEAAHDAVDRKPLPSSPSSATVNAMRPMLGADYERSAPSIRGSDFLDSSESNPGGDAEAFLAAAAVATYPPPLPPPSVVRAPAASAASATARPWAAAATMVSPSPASSPSTGSSPTSPGLDRAASNTGTLLSSEVRGSPRERTHDSTRAASGVAGCHRQAVEEMLGEHYSLVVEELRDVHAVREGAGSGGVGPSAWTLRPPWELTRRPAIFVEEKMPVAEPSAAAETGPVVAPAFTRSAPCSALALLDPKEWSKEVILTDNLFESVESVIITTVARHTLRLRQRQRQRQRHSHSDDDANASRDGTSDGEAEGGTTEARRVEEEEDAGLAGTCGGNGSEPVSPRPGPTRLMDRQGASTTTAAAAATAEDPAHREFLDSIAQRVVEKLREASVAHQQPLWLFPLDEAELMPPPESFSPNPTGTGGADALPQEAAGTSQSRSGGGSAAAAVRAVPNTFRPFPIFTPAGDIWQLGMLTLCLADGTNRFDTRTQYPSSYHCRSKRTDFSECFHRFLQRCLQPDARKRPTARELLQDEWFHVTLDQHSELGCVIPKKMATPSATVPGSSVPPPFPPGGMEVNTRTSGHGAFALPGGGAAHGALAVAGVGERGGGGGVGRVGLARDDAVYGPRAVVAGGALARREERGAGIRRVLDAEYALAEGVRRPPTRPQLRAGTANTDSHHFLLGSATEAAAVAPLRHRLYTGAMTNLSLMLVFHESAREWIATHQPWRLRQRGRVSATSAKSQAHLRQHPASQQARRTQVRTQGYGDLNAISAAGWLPQSPADSTLSAPQPVDTVADGRDRFRGGHALIDNRMGGPHSVDGLARQRRELLRQINESAREVLPSEASPFVLNEYRWHCLMDHTFQVMFPTEEDFRLGKSKHTAADSRFRMSHSGLASSAAQSRRGGGSPLVPVKNGRRPLLQLGGTDHGNQSPAVQHQLRLFAAGSRGSVRLGESSDSHRMRLSLGMPPRSASGFDQFSEDGTPVVASVGGVGGVGGVMTDVAPIDQGFAAQGGSERHSVRTAFSSLSLSSRLYSDCASSTTSDSDHETSDDATPSSSAILFIRSSSSESEGRLQQQQEPLESTAEEKEGDGSPSPHPALGPLGHTQPWHATPLAQGLAETYASGGSSEPQRHTDSNNASTPPLAGVAFLNDADICTPSPSATEGASPSPPPRHFELTKDVTSIPARDPSATVLQGGDAENDVAKGSGKVASTRSSCSPDPPRLSARTGKETENEGQEGGEAGPGRQRRHERVTTDLSPSFNVTQAFGGKGGQALPPITPPREQSDVLSPTAPTVTTAAAASFTARSAEKPGGGLRPTLSPRAASQVTKSRQGWAPEPEGGTSSALAVPEDRAAARRAAKAQRRSGSRRARERAALGMPPSFAGMFTAALDASSLSCLHKHQRDRLREAAARRESGAAPAVAEAESDEDDEFSEEVANRVSNVMQAFLELQQVDPTAASLAGVLLLRQLGLEDGAAGLVGHPTLHDILFKPEEDGLVLEMRRKRRQEKQRGGLHAADGGSGITDSNSSSVHRAAAGGEPRPSGGGGGGHGSDGGGGGGGGPSASLQSTSPSPAPPIGAGDVAAAPAIVDVAPSVFHAYTVCKWAAAVELSRDWQEELERQRRSRR